ncbi:MAG: hypothetical protein H7301_11530 [Cryobacterium sp.]|nr:hypothetical protein [Oligoflexia bacterium]
MFPRISAALNRALEPVTPLERPGGALKSTLGSDADGGGHGAPGYEQTNSDTQDGVKESAKSELKENEGKEEPVFQVVPFRPGLTQVILDLKSVKPPEASSNMVIRNYISGAKDQKSDPQLPKGARLDKKAS